MKFPWVHFGGYSNTPKNDHDKEHDSHNPEPDDQSPEPDTESPSPPDTAPPAPAVSVGDGLWDNIRQKKEREGKNYKPAKPGDKDRPDTDMWKKLTKKTK